MTYCLINFEMNVITLCCCLLIHYKNFNIIINYFINISKKDNQLPYEDNTFTEQVEKRIWTKVQCSKEAWRAIVIYRRSLLNIK